MSENENVQVKRRRKKRRKKHPLLRLLIFALLVAALVYFLNSSFFYISKFEISGNNYLNNGQIVVASELKTGKNIFFETNLKQARLKLLESPYVYSAEIKRVLPNTITISIVEREEFAAVQTDEGYIIVDKDGLVLRESVNEQKMPILSGLSIVSKEEGKALEVESGYLLTKGLRLLEKAEEEDFYFERLDLAVSSVKAYIYYDQYYCEGSLDNLIDSMPIIKVTVATQFNENITHGIVHVGANGYISYSP